MQDSTAFRVTIRYYRDTMQYEILQLTADDLREAVEQVARRFPSELVDSADLVEIRRTNPVE